MQVERAHAWEEVAGIAIPKMVIAILKMESSINGDLRHLQWLG